MSAKPPRIFDRTDLARARQRAERMARDMFLVREAADGIVSRVATVNRAFAHALGIDPFADSQSLMCGLAATWTMAALSGDERLEPAATDMDLATSVLGLHAVNDLPGALIQIRKTLKPDGMFAAALFGGATLQELRESLSAAETEIAGGVSPHVSPFADVRDLGNLLQRAGFALPVADTEKTAVLYTDLRKLFEDLRAHGQSNALVERRRAPISREVLRTAETHYRAHHAGPDGKLRATFEIIYLTGFAPSPDQPKPLRPGSARARLADALGTKEIRAGEITPRPRKDQT